MKKLFKKLSDRQVNLVIILMCVLSLVTLFTIDGYIEFKEEQRNKAFLCNQSIVVKGDLATYFFKGINPSY